MSKCPPQETFLGSVTISEKGQVVIPVEARKLMGLKKGEKLLVFHVGDSLLLSNVSRLEAYARVLSGRLTNVRKIVRTTKSPRRA